MQIKPLTISETPIVSPETLLRLPDELRRRQPLFDLTGGLHAVGLFDHTGECCCVFEDIGRHNATD